MVDPNSKSIFVSEKELLDFITKHPEEFLEHSRVLTIEYPTAVGRVDGLLIDDNDVLWILETKIRPDELQLNQVMRYYDWMVQNKDTVYRELGNLFSDVEIIRDIGIILVAPAFGAGTSRIAKYLKMPIHLVTYNAFQDIDGTREIRVGKYHPQIKPPSLDVTLVVMAYMLDSVGIEPTLEKIGMQLRGLYSANELYDEAIRLSKRGTLFVGITGDNEYGVSISSEAAHLAKELYDLYWKRLEIIIERK